MLRIKIEDFQSIKNADLEVDGFTVITGSNNSGKTAVIRAVRGAVSNAGGASFVRHGASHTSVSLEFQEGGRLIWQKGDRGINRYQIDGKPFDNIGRTVPEEVERKGIIPVQVGDKKLWPQIASQIVGQVFLLDEMGWVVAEAISDITRVTALNKALKNAESDRRRANTELKIRQQDHQIIKKELARFSGFEEVEEIVGVLEKQVTYGHKLVEALAKLEWLQEQMGRAHSKVNQLSGIEEIEIPPEERFTYLQKLIHNIDRLETTQTQMQQAHTQIQHYETILAQVVELDLHDLEEKADKLSKGIQRLDGFNTQLERASKTIDQIEVSLNESVANLDRTNQAIRDILGDLQECPVCGSLVLETK